MKSIRFCSVGVLAVSLLAGCANTDEMTAIRTMAEQAQADAQMAKDTSEQALATANEAMAMSRATDERINRMFKRSMLK